MNPPLHPGFTGADDGVSMAGRGSPWDGAPTAPLPAGPYLGDTGQSPGGRARPTGPGAERPGARGGPPGRARRRHRWLPRIVTIAFGLVLVGALALGGLFLVTPSVGDAQARAQQLDRQHHVAYPGPAVPARFAVSLVSTEDHRFYSEPGIDPFAVGRLVVGRLSGRPDQGGATLSSNRITRHVKLLREGTSWICAPTKPRSTITTTSP